MTVLLVSEALAKSHIKGYTKSDGTVVKPHEDKRQAKQPANQPAKWSSGAPASSSASKWGWSGSVVAPQYGKGSTGSLFGGHDAPEPKPKAYHPKTDENGAQVGIYSPHEPNLEALSDPQAIATITPGCAGMPASLNGIPFAGWTPPESDDQWDYVDGQMDDLDEPPMHCPIGKQPASGLIMVEPDGRVWVVSPTNKFGGYKNSFPKGKVEEEMSFQANAIKEAWEEAGLKGEITGFLGDVERTTSVTRYYLARRVAGDPSVDVTWESQAIHLCPQSMLTGFLDAKVDHQVAELLQSVK